MLFFRWVSVFPEWSIKEKAAINQLEDVLKIEKLKNTSEMADFLVQLQGSSQQLYQKFFQSSY